MSGKDSVDSSDAQLDPPQPAEGAPLVDRLDYQTAEQALPSLRADLSPRFLPAIGLALLFTGISVLICGLPVAVPLGMLMSGILTLYWGYLNYQVCRRRSHASEISPMRALAMSVFVNQFGGAHAALFANSIFEITFPVIRTLHPPQMVFTFAAVAGFLVLYVVVTMVACLTMWWHIQLANKVYGDGTGGNTLRGVVIGLVFCLTAVWLMANVGSAKFNMLAPVVANSCYIAVFLVARTMLLARNKASKPAPTQPLSDDASSLAPPGIIGAVVSDSLLPVAALSLYERESRRRTVEGLLLLIYAVTLLVSNPVAIRHGSFEIFFCGVPVLVWLAYLVSETRAQRNLERRVELRS